MFFKNLLRKISVIIPAYNVEDYVEYCLNSVVNQEYTNVEIIVVDDGSTDLTPQILDFWQEQYPDKIKVIHTSHSGVGNARNIGLNAATGEYIAFVDSDDEINKNMYNEMLKIAENEKADIVICDVLLNEENIGGKKTVQHSINFGEYTKENYLCAGINLCSLCNKLFRRHLFNGEVFRCMTYEDMALVPVLVSKANKLSFIKKHYYHYNRRNNSITTNEFRVEDFFDAITLSVENVKDEHKHLLSYWHAKSLLNLVNGERKDYIDEFTFFLRDKHYLFLNNELIMNDPYTEKIIYGRLIESESCADVSDMFLTIISDLNSKLLLDEMLNNINEDVQILSPKAVCQQQIRGRFILCLDEYVELPENLCASIDLVNNIYSNSTFVFAIPKKKSMAKDRIIDIENKPESIILDNYVFVINAEAFKKQKIRLTYNKREILYYALFEKRKIYLFERFCIQPTKFLKMEADEKELFSQYQQIVEFDINSSIRCCLAQLMGIPKYIQHFIMSDIRKLVETDYSNEIVNTKEFIQYRNGIQYALSMIDDDVILGMKKVTPEHTLFYFNKKYNREADILSSKEGLQLLHNGRCIYVQDQTYTMLEFCDYINGVLRLEGRTICINVDEDENIVFFAVVNDVIIGTNRLTRDIDKYCLGELLYKGIEFEVCIPIEGNVDDYKIQFFYMYRGKKIARKDIRFGKFFPLTKKYSSSYYQKDDRILTFSKNENAFHFHIWGRKGRIWKEKLFLAELKEKFPKRDYKEIAKLRRANLIREIFPFNKRRIWLISDKMSRGDDNGEAFFRFMNSARKIKKKIKTYYLMDKSSKDYLRLRKIGKIVQFNSYKHKLLSLICENHFIAYANDAVTKPLLKYSDCFKDIMKREWIIFLQHGPTQNNVSSALNKYNQNFKAIVTVNEEERNSFLEYNYYYRKEQITLTGFPRYDYLKNTDKKMITFAPTWRRKLFGQFIQQEERYVLREEFKNSEYYKFYAGIINSSILREAVKERGYELHFIPHPVFFPYINEFDFGPEVAIHGVDVSYNQMFCNSSLFVTDYSSAVFDCAYLMKPVVYTQFDTEDFYKNQYERGMFDYDEEGFGPVVDSVESAVEKIVGYINGGCVMEEIYRSRVLKYFKYWDKKNASRIFEEFY